MSAFEEVLVNLGSTLMSFAPLCCAIVTYLNEMGWFSAALLPMISMQSLFFKSIQWFVIAPRPNDSARAATVALCQIRAWCSI